MTIERCVTALSLSRARMARCAIVRWAPPFEQCPAGRCPVYCCLGGRQPDGRDSAVTGATEESPGSTG